MGTLYVCDEPLQTPDSIGIWNLVTEAQQIRGLLEISKAHDQVGWGKKRLFSIKC